MTHLHSESVLCIDLDGTVMTNPFWPVVFPTVFEDISRQCGCSAEEARNEVVAENKARLESPSADAALAMDWDDIVQTVSHRLGGVCGLSLERLVSQHALPPWTSLIDHADQVLSALAHGGRRRLVASSMGLSKYQFPVLRALGLFDLFDDFLMPDLTAYLKTDSRFFDACLAGRNPASFIAIGDKYVDDVANMKRLGMRAVLRFPDSALRAISPLARPRSAAIGELINADRQNAELPDAVLPDAVVVDLQELSEVIPQLERLQRNV